MKYVTTKCPSCGKVIRKQTNPPDEIGIPFERCYWCNTIYRNTYKEEWITKSPLKRFFFFLQAPVWARAIMLPMLIICIPLMYFDIDNDIIVPIWMISSIVWLSISYFLYKNASQDDIAESLNRTKDMTYLNILIQAGYPIYPVKNFNPKEKTNEYATEFNDNVDEGRYCKKCGRELLPNARFCNGCGMSVSKITDTEYKPKFQSSSISTVQTAEPIPEPEFEQPLHQEKTPKVEEVKTELSLEEKFNNLSSEEKDELLKMLLSKLNKD